jgi:hypothetical protein
MDHNIKKDGDINPWAYGDGMIKDYGVKLKLVWTQKNVGHGRAV